MRKKTNRVFSILLTLVMLLTLLPAPAQAAIEKPIAVLTFTTEPQSGTVLNTEDYTATWATNKTPDILLLEIMVTNRLSGDITWVAVGSPVKPTGKSGTITVEYPSEAERRPNEQSTYRLTVGYRGTTAETDTCTFTVTWQEQEENIYTIKVRANVDSYGTVTGGGKYPKGAIAELRAIGNDGYRLAEWTENGIRKSDINPWAFVVTKSYDLVAVFEKIPEIYIGGKGLLSGQYLGEDGTVSDYLSDNFAYYANGYLTLQNFDYCGTGEDEYDYYSGIRYNDPEKDLQLILKGKNSLTLTSDESDGIYIMNTDLIVTEAPTGGSLTISGVKYSGICCDYGSVMIQSGTVDIISDQIGIYSFNGNVDVGRAELNITSGTIGICIEDWSTTLEDSNIRIKNGLVNIDSGAVGLQSNLSVEIFDGVVAVTGKESAVYTRHFNVYDGVVTLISTAEAENDEICSAIHIIDKTFGKFTYTDSWMNIAVSEDPAGISTTPYDKEQLDSYDYVKLKGAVVTYAPIVLLNVPTPYPGLKLDLEGGHKPVVRDTEKHRYAGGNWYDVTDSDNPIKLTDGARFEDGHTYQFRPIVGIKMEYYHDALPTEIPLTLSGTNESSYVVKDRVYLGAGSSQSVWSCSVEFVCSEIKLSGSVTVSGTSARAGVTVENFFGTAATLIVTQYSGDQMKAVQTVSVTADGTFAPDNPFTHAEGCTYKAFLVNADTYAPLCAAAPLSAE